MSNTTTSSSALLYFVFDFLTGSLGIGESCLIDFSTGIIDTH